jgi:hypothetical protein
VGLAGRISGRDRPGDAVGRPHGGAQPVGKPVDGAAVRTRSRAEGHFLVNPGRIERLEVVRLGIGLGSQDCEGVSVELRPRDRQQGGHRRLVARAALGQALTQSGNDVCRLADQLDGRMR